MKNKKKLTKTLLFLCAALFAGCNKNNLAAPEGQEPPMGRDITRKRDFGRLFGEDFLLFSANTFKKQEVQGVLRVNPFLWEATLETLSFLPLVSADASGGVIVSDWHATPQHPHERVKVTAKISGGALCAEGIKISMHKQVLSKGNWITATVDDTLNGELEDIILRKARELRVKSQER